MERVKRTFARMLADRDYDLLVATPSFPNGNKDFDASFVFPEIASQAAVAAHARNALRVLNETRNIEETERRVGKEDVKLALVCLLYKQKGLTDFRYSMEHGNTNFFPWFEVAYMAQGTAKSGKNGFAVSAASNVLNNLNINVTQHENTFKRSNSYVLLPNTVSPEGYNLVVVRTGSADGVLDKLLSNNLFRFEAHGTAGGEYRYFWINAQVISKLQAEFEFERSVTGFISKYISNTRFTSYAGNVPYEDVVEVAASRLTLKNVYDFAAGIVDTNAYDSWSHMPGHVKDHFGIVQKKLAAILVGLNAESKRNVGIALVQGILDEVDYKAKERLRQVRSEPFHNMIRELLNEIPWLRSDSRLSSFLRTGNDLAGSDIHAR